MDISSLATHTQYEQPLNRYPAKGYWGSQIFEVRAERLWHSGCASTIPPKITGLELL